MINGASAALTLSEIPLMTTVGAVRVSRVDGAFVINPTHEEIAKGEAEADNEQALAAALRNQQITLQREMLVRAYDPCISCSVHMLDVDFIE